MKTILVVVSIYLMKTMCHESFIKTINGPINEPCGKHSTFYTNYSDHFNDGQCNKGNACSVNKNDILFYLCLKSEFECRLWNNSNIREKGCFYKDKSGFISLPHSKNHHFFVLSRNVSEEVNDKTIYHSIFSSFICKKCKLHLGPNTKILYKFSNKSEEDFGEFFVGNSPPTPTPKGGKGKDYNEDKEGKHSSTTNDYNEDKEGKHSSTTNDYNEDKEGKHSSTTNVFIILGAVGIILLIIFLLAAFIFYRLRISKRTVNTESGNSTIEIPLKEKNESHDAAMISGVAHEISLDENGANAKTPDGTVPCKEFGDHLEIMVDNELYQLTTSEDRSQRKAQNKEHAEAAGIVYAEINWRDERIVDCPMDPEYSSSVYANRDTYTVSVDNELYEATTPGNKECTVTPGDVYAVVNKKEGTKTNFPMDPRDPSHMEVGGDIYAVVNK